MSTHDYEAGTFEAPKGTTWHVTFNDRTARFTAEAQGYRAVSAKNWEDLVNAAKVQVSQSRVKVSVPYARLIRDYKGRRIIAGTATGIHSANRNILITENGKPGQMDRFGGASGALKPVKPEDAERYLALLDESDRISREISELLKPYKFGDGLAQAVESAIEEARKAQGPETGGETGDAR